MKTISFNELKEFLLESSYREDKWVEEYIEKNPEAYEKILKWVKWKNPNMPADEQTKFAKNILKKKQREGRLDADQSSKKRASKEDEDRFIKEIKNYGTTSNGKIRGVDDRWLKAETGNNLSVSKIQNGKIDIRMYKPVGFDENDNVILDIYGIKYFDSHTYHDGDYDDGCLHEWDNVTYKFIVDEKNKIGETTGKIKDGKVVLSDGKVLVGWGSYMTWSFHENHRTQSNYYK